MSRSTRVSKKDSGPSPHQITLDQLETAKREITDLQEALTGQGRLLDLRTTEGAIARAAALGNAKAAQRINEHFAHTRKTMVESLTQERQDLVSRLLRIDQRLEVLGVNVGPSSSYNLVLGQD